MLDCELGRYLAVPPHFSAAVRSPFMINRFIYGVDQLSKTVGHAFAWCLIILTLRHLRTRCSCATC